MSVQKCTRCGDTKAADEMVIRNGKPSKCCRECFKASFAKGGKKKKSREERPAPEKAYPVVAEADAGLVAGPALSIAPGLGVEAWIENGCLQLSQGNDVVALSKTEATVLFAQFAEWVRV